LLLNKIIYLFRKNKEKSEGNFNEHLKVVAPCRGKALH